MAISAKTQFDSRLETLFLVGCWFHRDLLRCFACI